MFTKSREPETREQSNAAKQAQKNLDAFGKLAHAAIGVGVAAAGAVIREVDKKASEASASSTPSSAPVKSTVAEEIPVDSKYIYLEGASPHVNRPPCWCGFTPPESKCAVSILKTTCIIPAGIAWILGMMARVTDNVVLCVCFPCIGGAYASYKAADAIDFALTNGMKAASGTADEAAVARDAVGRIAQQQREMECMASCMISWERLRRQNGRVLCPVWVPCGICISALNPWPRSSEEIHGHWLEAPCQVCYMDEY